MIGIVLSKITPGHIVFVAKNKNVDIPSVGENMEYRWNFYTLLVGTQNGTAILKKSLVDS